MSDNARNVHHIVDSIRAAEPAERHDHALTFASKDITDRTAKALIIMALSGCEQMATELDEYPETEKVGEWTALIALLLGSAERMQRIADTT